MPYRQSSGSSRSESCWCFESGRSFPETFVRDPFISKTFLPHIEIRQLRDMACIGALQTDLAYQ